MAGKWLFKSDPEHYSYQDLAKDKKTVWDGISNNLALKHLRNVRRGDEVMIYHSGGERAVVGLAEVLSDPYQDPKKKEAGWWLWISPRAEPSRGPSVWMKSRST